MKHPTGDGESVLPEGAEPRLMPLALPRCLMLPLCACQSLLPAGASEDP
jgi:hypothetical protein